MPPTSNQQQPTRSLISNRNHPHLKRFRSLQHRQTRDATNRYLIEDGRFLIRATQARVSIDQLILAPEFPAAQALDSIVRRLQRSGVPTACVTRNVFHSLSLAEEPQGIAAIVRQRWSELPLDQASTSCWLAVSRIQSPGNLGTMIRTCEAVGAGLMLLDPEVDPFDPACVRAAMGGHFGVPLVRTQPATLQRWRLRHGLTLIGTSPAATLHYRTPLTTGGTILLMGCERQGLTAEELTLCDHIVRIPMLGRCDSLNVAVATGIMLYAQFDPERDSVSR